MRMKFFIDQFDWLRSKTDLADFLLVQPEERHIKFIYGERPQDEMGELTLFEILLANVNLILYSDKDVVWTKRYGLMERNSAKLTEHLWEDTFKVTDLNFEDDIKKLYMEILS